LTSLDEDLEELELELEELVFEELDGV